MAELASWAYPFWLFSLQISTLFWWPNSTNTYLEGIGSS